MALKANLQIHSEQRARGHAPARSTDQDTMKKGQGRRERHFLAAAAQVTSSFSSARARAGGLAGARADNHLPRFRVRCAAHVNPITGTRSLCGGTNAAASVSKVSRSPPLPLPPLSLKADCAKDADSEERCGTAHPPVYCSTSAQQGREKTGAAQR